MSAGLQPSLDTPPPKVGSLWAQRWLKQQDDLFKIKKKPISAAQKNAHDAKVLMKYFETYKAVVEEFEILLVD